MEKNEILNLYTEYLEIKHPLHILEESKDPFVVGTAVILSGNCTDAAVNKMLPQFLTRYPNASSVLEATRDEMIPLMPGISHSGSKSDYIKNWAKFIVANNGDIGENLDILTTIPGIGRKTGSIILYRVKGVDQGFPLDTHCLRVLDRLGWYTSKKPKGLERELLKDFKEGTRHQAHVILTQHGRLICRPRNPNCVNCKFNQNCNFYKKP